jgi:DNA gyrase subunit A
MVQRTAVRGISRYGRMAQGVRVMNMKDDDLVSAVALVVESANGDSLPLASTGGDGGSADGADEPADGAQAGSADGAGEPSDGDAPR